MNRSGITEKNVKRVMKMLMEIFGIFKIKWFVFSKEMNSD